MIDTAKRRSLIQWYNALSTTKDTVQALSQFTDGAHFYDMVISVKRDASNLPQPTPAVQHAPETVSDRVVIKDIIEDVVTDISTGDVSAASTSEDKGLGIEERYEAIQDFVDATLKCNSASLVSYTECMNGKDLEVAKVAVLLMSAVVQQCLIYGGLHDGSPLYTSTVLQQSVQEDIREMLSICMFEEHSPLKKADFHKVLSRATVRSKGTPRRRPSARGTDLNETFDSPKSLPKKRNQAKFIQDEIIESPLKSLLESPQIQQRAAMFRKDAEISKLRNSLTVEEMKVVDLSLDKRALNEELEKRKKEIENLKVEHRKYREFVEDADSSRHSEIEQLTTEKEKMNEQVQTYKEEIRILKYENESLQSSIDELEGKLSQKLAEEKNSASAIDNLNVNIKIKDDKIIELKEALKKLEEKADTKAEINDSRESETRIFDLATRNEVEKLKEDCKELLKQFQEEEENRIKFENLADVAENERQAAVKECQTANNQIEELKTKLDTAEAQIAIYKNWEKSQVAPGPSSSSVNVSRVRMEKSVSCSSGLYGKLWDNVSAEDVVGSTTSGDHAASALLITPTYNCSRGEFNLLKRLAKNIFKSIPRIHNPKMKEHLAIIDSMNTMKEVLYVFNRLEEVVKCIPANVPVVPRQRRSRSQVLEEVDQNVVKINALEKKIETLEQNHLEEQETIAAQLREKEQKIQEFRLEFKELQFSHKTLKDDLQKKKNEANELLMKYETSKKMNEKQKSDNKKLMQMYLLIKRQPKPDETETELYKECGILKKKFSEVKKDLQDSKCETQELKTLVKDLQSKNLNLQREVIEQKKEIKKLEFRIQREAAFLAGDASSRYAVVQKYFEQGLAESERKAKVSSFASGRNIKPEEPRQILNVNTYILQQEKKSSVGENSMSSFYANRSIRSGFLQTDDEEDFLNHSSLAQIRNGNAEESESTQDDRLGELRRRNTLCLPHLQSSYPLEIQNMTPSEKKYYDGLVSYGKDSASESDQVFYHKREIGRGSDSDESQDAMYIPLKKRKVVVPEASFSQAAARKIGHKSAAVRRNTFSKPATPVRKTGSITKNKPFKTPSSIRRLMRISRKNKEQ